MRNILQFWAISLVEQLAVVGTAFGRTVIVTLEYIFIPVLLVTLFLASKVYRSRGRPTRRQSHTTRLWYSVR